MVGPQEAVAAVCVGPDDDMEQRRRDILDGIEGVDRGVVVLTGMFGGTPSNLAISIMGLMMPAAAAGCEIELTGAEAQAALVERRFDEDQCDSDS